MMPITPAASARWSSLEDIRDERLRCLILAAMALQAVVLLFCFKGTAQFHTLFAILCSDRRSLHLGERRNAATTSGAIPLRNDLDIDGGFLIENTLPVLRRFHGNKIVISVRS